jgi:hypothetical protein
MGVVTRNRRGAEHVRSVGALPARKQPANQRQHDAHNQTGDDGEIERRILPAQDDVAGQASKTNRQAFAEGDEDSENHQRDSGVNQEASHDSIIS